MVRDECTLWLLVHTMTVTEVDYQVRAQFIHAVLGGSQGTSKLLAKKVRMTIRPNVRGGKRVSCCLKAPSFRTLMRRKASSVKHHLRTMQVDNSCSSSKFSPSASQANSQSNAVTFSPKQVQPQQPIVQIVAPLQQLQVNPEPIKPETQPALNGNRITINNTPKEVIAWLKMNRFEKFTEVFQNFSGHDLLRLSRNDVLQICGEVDGIRFFNALHDKSAVPRVKIYVCHANNKVFHAVFLINSTKDDLKHELCNIVGISHNKIQEVYIEGPNNINILVSDSVVYYLKEESAFSVSIVKEKDQFVLLMKLLK